MSTTEQLADRLGDQGGAALLSRCRHAEWPDWMHENTYQMLLRVELVVEETPNVWGVPRPLGYAVAGAFLERHPERVRAVGLRFGDVGLLAILARTEAGHEGAGGRDL